MPVYAHAKPKQRPTEFMVHNRFSDVGCEENVYFGHPFIVQCQNDWTNARAGAHVLGQACRYLAQPTAFDGHAEPRYEQANQVISDLIDVLVAGDRDYVRLALGGSGHPREPRGAAAMALSDSLERKTARLLKKLPFKIIVTTIDAASTPPSKKFTKVRVPEEEAPFPFSLIRTIGNYMNVRHTLVLHWLTSATSGHVPSSVLYRHPMVGTLLSPSACTTITEASTSEATWSDASAPIAESHPLREGSVITAPVMRPYDGEAADDSNVPTVLAQAVDGSRPSTSQATTL
jgi:hypothetical protein